MGGACSVRRDDGRGMIGRVRRRFRGEGRLRSKATEQVEGRVQSL